jgi:transcriptional regulator with XRE-family HTH domain
MGDRLRKARQVTGLEQSEFAAELGVSRGTVLNYENDRVKPRLIVLRAWSLRTGVPLHWLRDGEKPQPVGAGASDGLPRLDLNQRPSD